MGLEGLLTSLEVAELLGIKVQTLNVWRMRGRGPRFLKMGFNVRYRLSDVKAYMGELADGVDEAGDRGSEEREEEIAELRMELEQSQQALRALEINHAKLTSRYQRVLGMRFVGPFVRKTKMAFFDYVLTDEDVRRGEVSLVHKGKTWKQVDSVEDVTKHFDW